MFSQSGSHNILNVQIYNIKIVLVLHKLFCYFVVVSEMANGSR